MHKPCKLGCVYPGNWLEHGIKQKVSYFYVSWNLVPGCIPSYAYMAESTVCMVYRNVTVTIHSLFLCWESIWCE